MLMFVFGAGASFDSDPYRLWDRHQAADSADNLYRPPLATGLFEPTSYEARETAMEYGRATPLVMRLREAARDGLDIEEELERFQEEASRYSGAQSQLLALRAYLMRLLSTLPERWHEDCAGQTNYVRALDEALRWRESRTDHEPPVACVTFNYDTLLERAVERVHDRPLESLDDFVSGPELRVYKPHGSVNWRQRARWDVGAGNFAPPDDVLHWAIADAANIRWEQQFALADPEFPDYIDPTDAETLWLPALAIPARRKATFTMPHEHMASMKDALSKVTKVVAVGWRAREQHFLDLMAEAMPEKQASLVAVAESEASANATMKALWATRRFEKYALATNGFSGFVRSRRDPEEPSSPLLADVLDGSATHLWTRRS